MKLCMSLMRMRGLEPPRFCKHQNLNLACLPIPPHPQKERYVNVSKYFEFSQSFFTNL